MMMTIIINVSITHMSHRLTMINSASPYKNSAYFTTTLHLFLKLFFPYFLCIFPDYFKVIFYLF